MPPKHHHDHDHEGPDGGPGGRGPGGRGHGPGRGRGRGHEGRGGRGHSPPHHHHDHHHHDEEHEGPPSPDHEDPPPASAPADAVAPESRAASSEEVNPPTEEFSKASVNEATAPAMTTSAPVAAEEAAPTEANKSKTKKKPIKNSRMYGGEGGAEFDHTNRGRILEITVRSGAMVDGISVKYKNGDHMEGGSGGGVNTFTLKKDEYVTEVEIREGKIIQCLTFTTSEGTVYGPYGGKGGLLNKSGEVVTAKAPKGYRLIGFKGRSGKYLDAIGFHWGPVPE